MIYDSGPEVLFKTGVAMKFVDDDDDDWLLRFTPFYSTKKLLLF